MIGKPKFNYGDKVSFEVDGKTVVGIVSIIDRWGTFEQKEEVSYDIMVDNWMGSGEPMFCKHFTENLLTKVVND